MRQSIQDMAITLIETGYIPDKRFTKSGCCSQSHGDKETELVKN